MFTRSTRRLRVAGIAAIAAASMVLTACGGASSASSSDASGSQPADGAPSGSITVLTWRTDLVEDGTFDTYKQEFQAKYPDVDVEFEGITDYEGEVRTRMNTDDYGDVLAIPATVTPDQFPHFFEPLGDLAELKTQYRWLDDKSYQGKSYGIPVNGNVNGVVYNKRVWDEAGITELPTTPEQFLTDLATIKQSSADVTPLYTNYKDGWPLTKWEDFRGGITADADYVNEMTQTDEPWTAGTDHYVIDSLLYDAVSQKLTEDDPTSTNWELSKTKMGDGTVAAMMLGSWAIPQMQKAAQEAGHDAADIGYMPFPAQVDGKFHAMTGGDYNLAINVHSQNKPAARAWIDWFNHESGYSESQEGLSPLIDGPVPATLKDFEATGVQYLTLNPAPAGKESLLGDIDKAAEIGLTSPDYRQKIIDAARTGSQSAQAIFDDLNARWAQGRAKIESGS